MRPLDGDGRLLSAQGIAGEGCQGLGSELARIDAYRMMENRTEHEETGGRWEPRAYSRFHRAVSGVDVDVTYSCKIFRGNITKGT